MKRFPSLKSFGIQIRSFTACARELRDLSQIKRERNGPNNTVRTVGACDVFSMSFVACLRVDGVLQRLPSTGTAGADVGIVGGVSQEL